MLAVEFEGHVKNGVIKIPDEYRETLQGTLKIIILRKEDKNRTHLIRKRKGLKRVLSRIREKNIFNSIDSPVEWQKELRDEWH